MMKICNDETAIHAKAPLISTPATIRESFKQTGDCAVLNEVQSIDFSGAAERLHKYSKSFCSTTPNIRTEFEIPGTYCE